jgi:hypothetical protein
MHNAYYYPITMDTAYSCNLSPFVRLLGPDLSPFPPQNKLSVSISMWILTTGGVWYDNEARFTL